MYGFGKPNEDKMSVIQYLWECQVEIVVDGGWDSVLTLKAKNIKRNSILQIGEEFWLNCGHYEINIGSNGLSCWVTRAEYAPHMQTWVHKQQELRALL